MPQTDRAFTALASAVQGQLAVRALVREYPGQRRILDGLDLTATGGEAVAVTGPSGSGKTTLLNLIGGLDRPDSGSISWNGQELSSLSARELAHYRATSTGFVFQDHHLLPYLSGRQNVLLPALAAKRKPRSDEADALLERVGVLHRADALPAELSGGERQRVAIARALINGAGMLLCDEPTGSLDRETGERIINLLLELVEQRGLLVLLVTHNELFASRMHRAFHLTAGRLA